MSEANDFSLAVTRGEPTPEELAAVIAVLSEVYASEVANAKSVEAPKPSMWMRTRRQMRGGMRRDLGFGAWKS